MDFEFKDKYDIDDLLEVTRILRSENGCVWDREQDHKSIRMNVLEEAYEVMEAIDSDDPAMLKEELGDLLFQTVFHCQIEAERNRFEFTDICDDVAKKMIYRHPHVFSDVKVNNSDEVLKNWDQLKKQSKHQQTVADTLESVPDILPALMKAQKVYKRAANAGAEFNGTAVLFKSFREKLSELELLISDKKDDDAESKIGEILFLCCILSQFVKKNSEKALTFEINKVIMRFRELERNAESAGKSIEDYLGKDDEKLASFITRPDNGN